MQPSLVIIGLDFRTSTLEVRERFWISETRRYEAIHQLVRSEGIDEAVVLSTPYRTEFILWASDASYAANSVLRLLTREYDLKMCEWSSFYRLLDEAALTHLFRLASALDTVAIGDAAIVPFLNSAFEQARTAGTLGRFLQAVLDEALATSARVLALTRTMNCTVSMESGVVGLVRHALGTLDNRRVVIFGSSHVSEMSATALAEGGTRPPAFVNRYHARAEELAAKHGGVAVHCDHRWEALTEADILVTATGCPHLILLRNEIEEVMARRPERPFVILDLSIPRDVEPRVAEIPNVFLYNLSDLEAHVTDQQHGLVIPGAQELVANSVFLCRKKLVSGQDPNSITGARNRLDQLCRQELEVLREELGPFTEDQEQVLVRFADNITQRIASHLARELHDTSERTQREQMTSAIERLFNPAKSLDEDAEKHAVNR